MENESIAPTLDMLEAWWEAHPDEVAVPGAACDCVVAKPLAALTGLPVSFVPGEHHAHVWREGTEENFMNTSPAFACYLEKIVPVSQEIDELGIEFDLLHVRHVPASECLALIRKVRANPTMEEG